MKTKTELWTCDECNVNTYLSEGEYDHKGWLTAYWTYADESKWMSRSILLCPKCAEKVLTAIPAAVAAENERCAESDAVYNNIGKEPQQGGE